MGYLRNTLYTSTCFHCLPISTVYLFPLTQQEETNRETTI